MCPPAVSGSLAASCVASLKQGHCIDEARYRSIIDSMLVDELDRRQVPDDQLLAWEGQQLAVLSRAEKLQLDTPSRTLALQLIAETVMMINKSVSPQPNVCWFDAVQLFDMSTADLVGAPKAKVVTRALAVCLASLKLASSNLQNRVPPAMQHHLVARAASFGAALGDGAVTLAGVEAEERQLLVEMGAGLLMPTVVAWIDSFWTRFDVATRGRFLDVIAVAKCLSRSWAALCTWYTRPSADWSPRATAEGICGAVAVVMRLVSLETLRAPDVQSEQWRQACEAVATASQVVPRPSVAPPDVVLTALLFATKCNLALLRGKTLAVINGLRERLATDTRAH